MRDRLHLYQASSPAEPGESRDAGDDAEASWPRPAGHLRRLRRCWSLVCLVPVRLDGAVVDQDAAASSTPCRRAGWPDASDLGELPQGALQSSNIPRYFLNSVIISVGSTGLALILAVFAAYGFARFSFRGKPFWQAFVLVGQLLPTAAIIVPLFITLQHARPGQHLLGPDPRLHDHHPAAQRLDADQLLQGHPARARGSRDHRRRVAASASCSASRCRCRCPASSRW